VRVREGSYLPIHRRPISKLIEVIGPHLHHLDSLVPELRRVHVGPADVRSGRRSNARASEQAYYEACAIERQIAATRISTPEGYAAK
jgi:hypothetical protein